MIDKLMPLVEERWADVVAIEKSQSMCNILQKKYKKSDYVVIENNDVINHELPNADVLIVFLTMMFIPIRKRKALMSALRASCKQGGVIIVVDKVCDHQGYFSTVLKRLTMQFKLQQGAKPEDVLHKEMSLAGVQIPIDPVILGEDAKQFFRMGEFAGWVIEC
jgi:tRNA (cmo5U34)-methyltransferase